MIKNGDLKTAYLKPDVLQCASLYWEPQCGSNGLTTCTGADGGYTITL